MKPSRLEPARRVFQHAEPVKDGCFMPRKDPEQRKAYDAAYDATNRGKKKASRAARRKADPGKAKASDAAHYTANPEARKVSSARWRRDHPEEVKAYRAAYNAANREKRKARDAARRVANLEVYLAREAANRKAHPQVRRAAVQKREARKRGLPATLTIEEWESIKQAYRCRCAYCGEKETKKRPLTQDHVVPMVQGGGYIRENIVPACGPCNSKKFTGPPAKPVKLVLL